MSYLSRFTLSPQGNGGDRYAYQILNKYEVNKGVEINQIELPDISFKKLLISLCTLNLSYLKFYLFFKLLNLKESVNLKEGFRLYYLFISYRYLLSIKTINDNHIYIDDPFYSYKAIKKLKKRGNKVTGIIHNIETLVPDQVITKKQSKYIQKEIERIKLCDDVICISREEHTFLNNLGITSTWLPYQIQKEEIDYWESIQVARLHKKKAFNGYVFLGSYNNAPTRKSIHDLLEVIITQKLYLKFQFSFIGYNMANIYNQFQVPDEINILSSLSKKKLAKRLSECKAVICYQKQGAGSLTRIEELNKACIPIIANIEALRGYDINGTHILQTLSELEDKLE